MVMEKQKRSWKKSWKKAWKVLEFEELKKERTCCMTKELSTVYVALS